MVWYVKIDGHVIDEYREIEQWLKDRDMFDVSYYGGDWAASVKDVVSSFLKFEDEQDALAFILAKGGKILCKDIPPTTKISYWRLNKLPD